MSNLLVVQNHELLLRTGQLLFSTPHLWLGVISGELMLATAVANDRFCWDWTGLVPHQSVPASDLRSLKHFVENYSGPTYTGTLFEHVTASCRDRHRQIWHWLGCLEMGDRIVLKTRTQLVKCCSDYAVLRLLN